MGADDMRVDAHAMLDDWVLCTVGGGAQFVVGIVTGDGKGRFEDGACMSTSILTTPSHLVAEGTIVETLNSRYLLGRRESDPEAAHALLVAYVISTAKAQRE